MEQQGFFIKIRECLYAGPHKLLSEARSEARKIGPDLEIYHGIIRYIDDEIVDTKDLFLIPKVQK